MLRVIDHSSEDNSGRPNCGGGAGDYDDGDDDDGDWEAEEEEENIRRIWKEN